LYTADLLRLIERHGLQSHLYADNNQVLGSCPLRDIDVLQARLSARIDDVVSWMVSNRPLLNTERTELMMRHGALSDSATDRRGSTIGDAGDHPLTGLTKKFCNP
jgi:hypothetical protein